MQASYIDVCSCCITELTNETCILKKCIQVLCEEDSVALPSWFTSWIPHYTIWSRGLWFSWRPLIWIITLSIKVYKLPWNLCWGILPIRLAGEKRTLIVCSFYVARVYAINYMKNYKKLQNQIILLMWARQW